MLPNLRLLLTATLSTFLLTAAAGLFVSLRLAQDQLSLRSDARPVPDEYPVNRISMKWPLPEPDRAAALRELQPANPPWAGANEQAAPVIDAPVESAVAIPANPETQLAPEPEALVEKQVPPAPPIEEIQIVSQPEPPPAPEVTGTIGEPALSIPAADAAATKSASPPRDSRPPARKARAEKPAAQTKRASTQRTATRQFPLATPRAGLQNNSAAPFLFFGPSSSP